MPVSLLDGKNLGKRHHHFNLMVNNTVRKKIPLETILTEYGDSDIDNLFKIDIASEYRNVDYILQVFKSEDMLYVSRAIKKSTWLITDDQYAHIINPQHLHSELFPYMTSRAICKLLLHIRLNLKQEVRVDEFFKYLETKDFSMALKWLPNCSIVVIGEVLERHSHKISVALFKRLCEKSYRALDKFHKDNDLKKPFHKVAIFLLNSPSYTENYLREVKSLYAWDRFKFNKKQTKTILKNCPDMIFNNFDSYGEFMNMETLGKYIGQNNIKGFMLKHSKNNNLIKWFHYSNVSPLIKLMPKEDKFDFVKSVFINQSVNNDSSENALIQCAVMSRGKAVSSQQIYQWYCHAPFEIAFPDLTKLITMESLMSERTEILKTLLRTAGHDMNNLQELLKYYVVNHINDAFKVKSDFINIFLLKTKTHLFDGLTWKLLDDIFHSMEVYVESENNVQNCIEAIIVYNILHKRPIPEIIKKKFQFTTFKNLKNKLKDDEAEEIFNYVYNLSVMNISGQSLSADVEIDNALKYLENMVDLLTDWNMKLLNYQFVQKKIKEITKMKLNKEARLSLDKIYKKNKIQRRYMFEESLLITSNENVYINALKHDPSLLLRNIGAVDGVRYKDGILLRRLLTKLRIYWPQTLAKDWVNAYQGSLNQTDRHTVLTQGLCALLSSADLMELLDKYSPKEPNIAWSEMDNTLLSLRKSFARLMYHGRPQPSPDIILRYSQGDYLQYTLPSLTAIFSNLSSRRYVIYVQELLNGPMTLQKLGIQLAFSKLTLDEVKELFTNTWSTTKSPVMRAVIFESTFKLLCQEKNPSKVLEIWKVLEMFIDNLSNEENKRIYILLGKVYEIPGLVRAKFCMKSYKYLKSLPSQTNVNDIAESVALTLAHLMDSIDPEFVEEIIIDFVEMLGEMLISCRVYHCFFQEVIIAYLLCTNDENIQIQRFNRVLKPVINYCLDNWYLHCDGETPCKAYLDEFFYKFLIALRKNFLYKNYVVPTIMFTKFNEILESKLPPIKNYNIIITSKLLLSLVHSYDIVKSEIKQMDYEYEDMFKADYYARKENLKVRFGEVWPTMAVPFAGHCKMLLKEQLAKYFPSIQIIFNKSLDETLKTFTRVDREPDIELGKAMIKDETDVAVYLTALHILPVYIGNEEKYAELKEIRKIMMRHPSDEVQMHCSIKFFTYPELE